MFSTHVIIQCVFMFEYRFTMVASVELEIRGKLGMFQQMFIKNNFLTVLKVHFVHSCSLLVTDMIK
ncbi:unnamed protein product, partial [Callosobruchus maculatus]